MYVYDVSRIKIVLDFTMAKITLDMSEINNEIKMRLTMTHES